MLAFHSILLLCEQLSETSRLFSRHQNFANDGPKTKCFVTSLVADVEPEPPPFFSPKILPDQTCTTRLSTRGRAPIAFKSGMMALFAPVRATGSIRGHRFYPRCGFRSPA